MTLRKQIIKKRRFGPLTCFLCSRTMRSHAHTEEHIFPKWLQNRFLLWNQNITLINGTRINYRQLKVPCCNQCNNGHLSELENRMAAASRACASAVRELPELDLYLWLGKIYFGILYKEYLLSHDRSKPKGKPIIPRILLNDLELHHLYLQSAHTSIEYHGPPDSVFVFDLQLHRTRQYQFNYWDSLDMIAACRIGRVGVMVAFTDGGIMKQAMEHTFSKYYSKVLHSLQFDELTARFVYNVKRMQRTVSSLTIESDAGQIISIPNVPGFSLKPWFGPWMIEDYTKVLAQILKLPLELVFHPPDEFYTLLTNEQGEFCEMDVNDGNWP